MRLFLLPINSRNTLIYAQRLNKQLTAEQTRIEKVSERANKTWLRWESRDSGWQKKVTTWGNQLLSRIPYQEWGLKSIPPLSARRAADEIKGSEKVEVLFPGRLLPAGSAPDVLRKIVTERQGFHRQRMLWSITGMPITIPFALIPVIPNLPFFYLVFRALSHWKALKGAQHVTYLLDNKLLEFSQSSLLQKIYDIKELPQELIKPIKESLANAGELEAQAHAFAQLVEAEPTPEDTDKTADSDELFTTEGTGHLVSLCFGIPQVDVEIARATKQVTTAAEESRIKAGNQPDQKEKKQ